MLILSHRAQSWVQCCFCVIYPQSVLLQLHLALAYNSVQMIHNSNKHACMTVFTVRLPVHFAQLVFVTTVFPLIAVNLNLFCLALVNLTHHSCCDTTHSSSHFCIILRDHHHSPCFESHWTKI